MNLVVMKIRLSKGLIMAVAAVGIIVCLAWFVGIFTSRDSSYIMVPSPTGWFPGKYSNRENSNWVNGESWRHYQSCSVDLFEIQIVFRIWCGDHGGQYPWNVSTNAGGTKELCALDKDGFDANSFRHFQIMTDELSSPIYLVCPSDTNTKPNLDFESLAASNVTYRVHVIPGLAFGSTNKIPMVVCPADGSVLYYDGSVKVVNRKDPNYKRLKKWYGMP